MSWDYRFGGLILLSTVIDYFLAILISEAKSKEVSKYYLILSLFLNLVCILGFFKYYNFLSDSANLFLKDIGYSPLLPVLNVVLPVGVSFFTFQSLSYTIDVYRGVIPCEKSFIRFALFVSFFPQLVAGPIVTAKSFIPQLFINHKIEDIPFRKAIRYFLMGYVKKILISDNIASVVDLIYKNPENYSTEAIWLGAILFIIQLYCDFSGYTDMAYGSALLLGYELPENFRLPYLSINFTDFWRRWHLSLSIWIRDYIYFSLGGSKRGYFWHKFNLAFTMFLAGVWHGANWTFFIWGFLQGIIMAFESIFYDYKEKLKINKIPSKIRWILGFIYFQFLFVSISMYFRAPTIEVAWLMQKKMFHYTDGILRPYMIKYGALAILTIAVFHYIGYLIYEKGKEYKISPVLEFSMYPILFLIIALFTSDNELPFVYFQF